jgi:hypothetical protein
VPPGHGSPRSIEPWQTRVYGLALTSTFPILGLVPGGAAGDRRGPPVTITHSDEHRPAAGWSSPEVVSLARHDRSERGLTTSIETHPRLGYRLSASGFGWAQIDARGREVTISADAVSEWRSQRYLLAQVLPFAAGLHGLELLHAAGVIVDGAAVALVAGSGVGKSTLAAELVCAGAGFLADDVLALELDAQQQVIAHPGPALIVLTEVAAGHLMSLPGPAVGGDEGELALGVTTQPATKLRAVVVLERAPGDGPAVVEPLSPDDPRPLLAGAYETVRRDPARIAGQLSLLARVAGGARLLRLRLSADGAPDDAAGTLLRTLEGIE